MKPHALTALLVILAGLCPADAATLRGRVCDVFRDDVDDSTTFLALDSGGKTAYAIGHHVPARELERYLGCEVAISGEVLPLSKPAYRRHLKNVFYYKSTNDILVVRRPDAGPFDVPSLASAPPELDEIDRCGPRTAQGRVIARWRGDTFMLRSADGETTTVRLRNQPLPALGASVEAVGKVVSDLFRFHLVQAQWRTAIPTAAAEEPATPIPLARLFSRDKDAIVNTTMQGRTLRVRGTLKSLLADESGTNRLLLQDGAFQLVVDCSAAPELLSPLKEGALLEVTGVCVIEGEHWHSNVTLPEVTGLFLVPRTAADVRTLRPPPWWTPGRVWGVVGVLLATLVGILFWNAALRRLAVRKGRELMREQLEHTKAQLKTDERTRLAVELHDSISQNLTGISMQIDAAGRQLALHPEKTRGHLSIASRTLDSCRAELRNCIWDLRNQTLDERDMNQVLRRSLQPHVEGAELLLRFNVPRTRLSDNTAHALVRIIRELVTNAVRHGKARRIRIAGALETDRLLFSVSDDGCGFDPDACPGAAEGHFGLQGVRERIRKLHGTVVLESAPGAGTKATVEIPTRTRESPDE